MVTLPLIFQVGHLVQQVILALRWDRTLVLSVFEGSLSGHQFHGALQFFVFKIFDAAVQVQVEVSFLFHHKLVLFQHDAGHDVLVRRYL